MTVLSTAPGLEHAAGHADLPWDRARRLAAAATLPLPETEVPLSSAHGRRLAAAPRALVALPGADVSAMDGYAVGGPGPWLVVGEVLAGGGAVPAASSVPARPWRSPRGRRCPTASSAWCPTRRPEQSGLLVGGHCEPGRHIRRRGRTWPRARWC